MSTIGYKTSNRRQSLRRNSLASGGFGFNSEVSLAKKDTVEDHIDEKVIPAKRGVVCTPQKTLINNLTKVDVVLPGNQMKSELMDPSHND